MLTTLVVTDCEYSISNIHPRWYGPKLPAWDNTLTRFATSTGTVVINMMPTRQYKPSTLILSIIKRRFSNKVTEILVNMHENIIVGSEI